MQKKRRPPLLICQPRSSHYLISQIKQQETYAGMKTHYTQMRCSMDIIIPIGIYCYFEIDLLFEICEVSVSQSQSVNKRYSICQKPTQERPFAKRFSQDILPPA